MRAHLAIIEVRIGVGGWWVTRLFGWLVVVVGGWWVTRLVDECVVVAVGEGRQPPFFVF